MAVFNPRGRALSHNATDLVPSGNVHINCAVFHRGTWSHNSDKTSHSTCLCFNTSWQIQISDRSFQIAEKSLIVITGFFNMNSRNCMSISLKNSLKGVDIRISNRGPILCQLNIIHQLYRNPLECIDFIYLPVKFSCADQLRKPHELLFCGNFVFLALILRIEPASIWLSVFDCLVFFQFLLKFPVILKGLHFLYEGIINCRDGGHRYEIWDKQRRCKHTEYFLLLHFLTYFLSKWSYH